MVKKTIFVLKFIDISVLKIKRYKVETVNNSAIKLNAINGTNLNDMSNKVKNKETVQELKARLEIELSGKVNGISDDVLKLMSAQDLQKLKDKLTIINTVKEPVKAGRGNIAKNVVQWFLDNEITEAKRHEVRDVIRIENIPNFFKMKNEMPLPTTREAVNLYITLGYLKSSSNKVTDIAKREDDWLRRGEAYLRSHVVDDTYLKDDDSIGYYLIESPDGNVITLVNKEEEAKAKEEEAKAKEEEATEKTDK